MRSVCGEDEADDVDEGGEDEADEDDEDGGRRCGRGSRGFCMPFPVKGCLLPRIKSVIVSMLFCGDEAEERLCSARSF